VRRIIDGIAYDTDNATEVVGGSNNPHSHAWWGLYRSQTGTFFKIVVDHDGSTFLEFRPVTEAEARAVVEKHANHLVEKYFGTMPEVEPMRFSRHTIIAAIEVIENAIPTHAKLTRYLLSLGPELAARCDAGTLADRFNHLIKLFDEQPERRLADGNLLGDELVCKAVSLLPPSKTPAPWREASEPSPPMTALLRALDRDGFTITEGSLRRTLPASLKLPEAEDEIARLLTKHGFAVAKGHLDQAFAAHTEGRWASANSQIRSFFDDLTDQIAEKIDPSAATLSSGHARRAKLADLGFLSRDLNEWADNGNAYIIGLVKRLHPHGSHPGLSDQDDSTFRLHTVLLAARLLLVRFDKWGTL